MLQEKYINNQADLKDDETYGKVCGSERAGGFPDCDYHPPYRGTGTNPQVAALRQDSTPPLTST